MPRSALSLLGFALFTFLVTILGGFAMNAHAGGKQPGSEMLVPPPEEKPVVIEYYYKAKWGYADEFITLFKKNHYPVLKKQIAMGRILQVAVATPRFHNTEDGRWDYRVTLTFKNAQTAFGEFDSEPINKELYPDQETFKKEEQRRFEILLAHWDLPVNALDLEKK
ncbi:MAG TPA: hypothetical protein VK569_09425 [Bacteroidota bacterium]|nr:hypothetical protein [Bacteroidota bacterium]